MDSDDLFSIISPAYGNNLHLYNIISSMLIKINKLYHTDSFDAVGGLKNAPVVFTPTWAI